MKFDPRVKNYFFKLPVLASLYLIMNRVVYYLKGDEFGLRFILHFDLLFYFSLQIKPIHRFFLEKNSNYKKYDIIFIFNLKV